ncbi:MAG: TRAP transporter large permease subunit [Zestosphaera sp.]
MEIPLPIFMFLFLVVLLALNIPVAFALFITAIVFGLAAWGLTSLDIIFQGLWSTMNNWALVSIIPFILMSALLEECELVDEMYEALYKWLGGIRGSLLVISVILGAAIGAMSGVAAAGVVTLAMLVYPMMEKYNYPRRVSIGTIVFAGSLPQLIPPSLNMVIYGTMTGVSVGKLFAGGLGMGIVMTLLGIAYVLIWSHLHKDEVPVLEVKYTLKEKLQATKGLIGPTVIIVGTLGSIYSGMATPTEAASVGALLTLMYAVARRKLNRKALTNSLITTTRLTAMVCWIASGGLAFGSVFSGIGGRRMVVDFMTSLPEARISALIVALALVFILGMFIDTTSIAMIAGPILAPAIVALGYNPVWWGIIFCTILLTGFISPPVGMSMFLFKGARPDVSMEDIYKSTPPFLLIMVATTIVGIMIPEIPMFFVRLFTGT